MEMLSINIYDSEYHIPSTQNQDDEIDFDLSKLLVRLLKKSELKL